MQTVGLLHTMLPSRPTNNDHDSASNMLKLFSDKCHLDIFLHLCQHDYVGHNNVDPSLNVVDVCHTINNLNQVTLVNGLLIVNTPDELFDKFNELTVNLPDDTTKWTLQLCSAYLSALSPYLSERITSDSSFSMPNLLTLTTKAL